MYIVKQGNIIVLREAYFTELNTTYKSQNMASVDVAAHNIFFHKASMS
jgi:hypothetical protein